MLWGLAYLFSTVAAQADKRVALVIGNSAYQNAPTLVNPARDALAIATMFKKAGCDAVGTAYDVGYLDLKRAIRQFEDAAADADIAVVYFAGHGIEIHGVNYLISVDAKLASDRDADDEAITLDRLVAALDGAKRLRVVILDACRDNPFVRKMQQQRVAALRGVNPGLGAAEPARTDTLIAYAAKVGSQAEDGDGDHSPFAAALVNNLFVPGLDIRLAFGRVRDDVLKKTSNRQEPFVYGWLGGGNVSLVPSRSSSGRRRRPIRGRKRATTHASRRSAPGTHGNSSSPNTRPAFMPIWRARISPCSTAPTRTVQRKCNRRRRRRNALRKSRPRRSRWQRNKPSATAWRRNRRV